MRANFVDTLMARLDGEVATIGATVLLRLDERPDVMLLRRGLRSLVRENPRLNVGWNDALGEWLPVPRTDSEADATLLEGLHLLPMADATQGPWMLAIQLHHAIGDAKALGQLLERLWGLCAGRGRDMRRGARRCFPRHHQRMGEVMSRTLLLSTLLVVCAGCASTGNGQRPEGPEVRIGQRSAEPLIVTNTYVTGPSSSLRLLEDGIRGRFRDQLMALSWDYQKVSGMVDTRRTFLELSEGDDTRVMGSFGGSPVRIVLKDQWLEARVGACAYSLKKTTGGYTGKRDCPGAREEPFAVDFPESLQERPLGEMATLLTLAFVNYTDTYSASASLAGSVPVRSIVKGRREGPR